VGGCRRRRDVRPEHRRAARGTSPHRRSMGADRPHHHGSPHGTVGLDHGRPDGPGRGDPDPPARASGPAGPRRWCGERQQRAGGRRSRQPVLAGPDLRRSRDAPRRGTAVRGGTAGRRGTPVHDPHRDQHLHPGSTHDGAHRHERHDGLRRDRVARRGVPGPHAASGRQRQRPARRACDRSRGGRAVARASPASSGCSLRDPPATCS
jgi:hypothetical protein